MGTVYIADTENEGGNRYDLVLSGGKFRKKDRLYLFYTDNSPRQDYGKIALIAAHPGQVFTEHARCGRKDALDFQLSSFIGKLVSEAPKKKYVVLSNDTGYDSVVAFWAARKVRISRAGSAQEIPKAPRTGKATADAKASIGRILGRRGLEGFDTALVFEAFRAEDAKTQQAAMIRDFGVAKASTFYGSMDDAGIQEIRRYAAAAGPPTGKSGAAARPVIERILQERGMGYLCTDGFFRILCGDPFRMQDDLVAEFGREKTAAFFANTTKEERKVWRGIT